MPVQMEAPQGLWIVHALGKSPRAKGPSDETAVIVTNTADDRDWSAWYNRVYFFELGGAMGNEILRHLHKHMSPTRLIAASFLAVIILGGLLLSLPISHQAGVSVPVLDAFFTATSAVCIIGLVTLVTATTWSLFGKIIILLLVQIGGLSLITIFTFFIVHAGRKVTLKDRLTVQAAFNVNDLNGMVRLVLLVMRGTFLCEGIGAVLLGLSFWSKGMVWHGALANGVFHAVSAFCNAGFDLVGGQSLTPYADDLLINAVIMGLVVIGGIGFLVWRDLGLKIKYKIQPEIKKKYRLSLHTKLALITTGVLIALGTVYFFLAEYYNPRTLGGLSDAQKLLRALFQSVTLRTAGFFTVVQSGLTETSKVVSSLFMMIGGSPGGTAGGIKTVTVAIVFLSVWNTVRGEKGICAYKRALPLFTLQRALTVIVIMLLLWLGGSMILALTERGSPFLHTPADLLFEVASGLGTVGITTGITPFLTVPGKLLMMLYMFIGRIGPITIILLLQQRAGAVNECVQYPSEDVMIG